MEKDLSKFVLGFKVHSINTRVDHERGLVDGHSLCFFPSADRVFNEQADELLTGGPLFPIAATSHRSTLEPIGPDHPHREHFGFDYYDWMQSQKAASSAAAAAAATTTASTTAAPSAAGLGRPDACGSLSGDEASDSDSDCSIASFASDGARPRVPLTPGNSTEPGSECLRDTEGDLEPCSLRPPAPLPPAPPGLQGPKGGMAGTANKRPTSPSPLDPG